MNESASYARKFRRALKHLNELGDIMAAYEERRPYITIRDRQIDPDPRAWIYRAKLAEPPSPDIDLVVGDFLHNLRSSLDHVVVALAPRNRKRKASFPIFAEAIWETDPNTSEYVAHHEERRQFFTTAIKGLPEDAQTFIKGMQPYNLGAEAHEALLAILSSLDNGDKHAQLVTIGLGISHVEVHFRLDGTTLLVGVQPPDRLYRDGDPVIRVDVRSEYLDALPADSPLRRPEVVDALSNPNANVDVQVFGAPQVAVEVPSVGQPLPLSEMEALADYVRDEVLTRLEAFFPTP